MTKRNAENERIKRRYLLYLKDAKGPRRGFDRRRREPPSNASRSTSSAATSRNFHFEQARGFKAHLMAATQRADRQAPLGLDRSRDARGAEGVLCLARGSAGLRVADQVCRRRVFQPARQSVARRDRAPVQELARRSRRFARCSTPCRAETEIEQARPRAHRLHDPVRRARPGDRLVSAEAYRHRTRPDRTGRARGSDQAGEDLHDLVLPCRRRLPANRRRLGRVPARGKRLRTRRPAVSENQGRAGDDLEFRAVVARSRALGERQPGSRDFPRSLRARGLAVLQSALVAEHACSGRL